MSPKFHSPSNLSRVLAAIGLATLAYAQPPTEDTAAAPEYGPAHGTLLIVGGGTANGTGIMEKFVELAGGTNAKIIVVPTAGGNRTEDGRLIAYDEETVIRSWKRFSGTKNVRMLHTADPKVANTEDFVQPLREATGVWFNGGRQWNLVDSYANTLTEREFHRVLERGGVIGGSSAGATILGDYLTRGDVSGPDVVMTSEPEHQHGFAFLRRSAIDQHINTRNRWDDLTPVIKKFPNLLGIGLSEDTAIIVKGDRFTVMGKAKVAVHDDTRVYQPKEKPYYLLAAGEVYDMKTRQVVLNAGGQPPARQPPAATAADFAPAKHTEIVLEPDTLSRYAGAYQMAGIGVMLITVQNNQLFSKLGPQPAIPIFPASETVFFPKVVDAELEFANHDAQGRPTELTLRQNGREVPGKRLDDAAAKLANDTAEAFATRLKDQTPAPGGEARLREMAEDFSAGKTNSDALSPGVAARNPQLPQVRSSMGKLGAVQSLVFKGVGPGGADIYSVRFEKGALETRIWLGLDGKIENTNVRPDPNAAAPAADLTTHFPEIDSLAAAEFGKQSAGSVTVGIVSGSKLVWSKSHGEANMETKTAADADTVYRIGSITKMFTALMLEQLVEAGKVHLSDPVEKYFPEISSVKNRFPDAPPITLIQLATHTAGLEREPDDTATYVTGAVKDWEKTLVAALPHTRYILEPGTRFSYSNIGYAILGAALERAAGEPYVDYVPKHIFEPLGMTHSALESNAQVAAHLAKGYVMGRAGKVDADPAQRENETGRGYKVPNGAIYTTVGDLARFASFLMGQGPETVLKTSTLEKFQLQTIVPGDLALTTGYGVGFETERRKNYTAFGHNGGVAGYTAELLMNRKAGVGVIVLSSGSANPVTVAQEALDILSEAK